MDSQQHPDHDLLIRLDENVKELIRRFDGFIQTQTDHEKRIQQLEGWRWKLIGMAAGAGAAATFIVNWLRTKPL